MIGTFENCQGGDHFLLQRPARLRSDAAVRSPFVMDAPELTALALFAFTPQFSREIERMGDRMPVRRVRHCVDCRKQTSDDI